MNEAAQSDRIEVDQEQLAAVLLHAETHNMSPQQVVRHAIALYLGSALHAPHLANVSDAVRQLPGRDASSRFVQAGIDSKAGSNLPEGFVSRHPDRDYSWFGSLKGEFGDGVEYQKSIRAEW